MRKGSGVPHSLGAFPQGIVVFGGDLSAIGDEGDHVLPGKLATLLREGLEVLGVYFTSCRLQREQVLCRLGPTQGDIVDVGIDVQAVHPAVHVKV